ncbi:MULTISPECIES: DUF4124 domain-containing protein [unclassified Herbaspirillum]|nr:MULTISPECIES: DUF4124 domain-containing protein [unclassified Herbaspirillum]RFB73756.1 DUF4124 domain-containing protein [Herbaspirillum sp. 3R-3a1]TFI10436.1 DUF4124 domain-containing protein [Herbaspirillum sp. 3R11]TFI16341.1 DUF4124 domain-containing protein [Herbaspirillum sp. 3R-11]
MKSFVFIVLPGLLCAVIAHAAPVQDEVYVCVDQNGVTEYRNTGLNKGCRKLDMPAANAATPAKRAVPGKPATAVTAGAFPKADGQVQKARDSDRKLILQDELRLEEGKLAGLKADYNNGEPERRGDERNYAKYQERAAAMKDDIARAERNVDALRRELGKLR